MNRKERRRLKKQQEKKGNKELEEKIGLFDKIPDRCLTCGLDFDKTDKEQVTTWFVAVREKEQKVNLYCPTCWVTAQNLIKEFYDHMNSKYNEEEGEE